MVYFVFIFKIVLLFYKSYAVHNKNLFVLYYLHVLSQTVIGHVLIFFQIHRRKLEATKSIIQL